MYLRKKQEFKFDYDESSDDLFLFSPKSKSKGSVEFGDIVLDFNNKKELVGIELINELYVSHNNLVFAGYCAGVGVVYMAMMGGIFLWVKREKRDRPS